MNIQQFQLDEHMPLLKAWLLARDLYVPSEDEMPALTFVAYVDKLPVAMAALRKVEGGFAQLDGLCTNPEQSPEVRDFALDFLVSHLMQTAQMLGIKSVLAYTLDKNTLMRSKHHGFVQLPHTLIVAKATGV